jgi:hypothetical protein
MDETLDFESIGTLETVREDQSIGMVGGARVPGGLLMGQERGSYSDGVRWC